MDAYSLELPRPYYAGMSPLSGRSPSVQMENESSPGLTNGSGTPMVPALRPVLIWQNPVRSRSAPMEKDCHRLLGQNGAVWNADGSSSPSYSMDTTVWSLQSRLARWKKIATGSWDKTARVWSADGSGVYRSYSTDTRWGLSVAFSPDGSRYYRIQGRHRSHLQRRRLRHYPIVLSGHASDIYSVAFSLMGQMLLQDPSITRHEYGIRMAPGASVVLSGHKDSVLSVAFRPKRKDRYWLRDHTARMEHRRLQHLRRVQGSRGRLTSATFSQDGLEKSSLAPGTEPRESLEHQRLRVLRSYSGVTGYVTSVAFSPDGRKIVTGSWDRTARIWNTNGSRCSGRTQGPRGLHVTVSRVQPGWT